MLIIGVNARGRYEKSTIKTENFPFLISKLSSNQIRRRLINIVARERSWITDNIEWI